MTTKDATARPWRTSPDDMTTGRILGYQDTVVVCREVRATDAAFIVRAVNAHEALVTALRDCLRSLEAHLDDDTRHAGLGHRDILCPCNQTEVVKARAALALAEGKD